MTKKEKTYQTLEDFDLEDFDKVYKGKLLLRKSSHFMVNWNFCINPLEPFGLSPGTIVFYLGNLQAIACFLNNKWHRITFDVPRNREMKSKVADLATVFQNDFLVLKSKQKERNKRTK